MNYRQLQEKLKPYREQGLSDIKLNSPKAELEAELERLTVISHQSSVTSEEISGDSSDPIPDPLPSIDASKYPPIANDYEFFEEFKAEYDDWLEVLWDGDDDIAQSEEQFITAEELWEQRTSIHDIEPRIPDPLNQPFPCWLSSKQAAQAKALEKLEFWYIGSVDNWEEPEPDLFLSRYKDWAFYTAYMCPGFLEAHCKGAIFNAYIDEDASEQEYKDLIKKAKAILKETEKTWGEQFGTQLDIFTALNQANAPPQVA